jgi:hypothetical protein
MAYCGHKKEDIEDTSMNSYWKPARPAAPWNPWGQLPSPQQGGGEEESAPVEKRAHLIRKCLLLQEQEHTYPLPRGNKIRLSFEI